MQFSSEESGQGIAEYILLIGGLIVITIAILVIYYRFIQNPGSFKQTNTTQPMMNYSNNK